MKEALFSILIPSWNNLPFLQLCIESIRKNSMYQHQIIIHVNDGSDGTLQWVKEQGVDYTHSVKNVGVCLAMNMMRTKVQTDYMVFLNDDMYVLPGWDKEFYNEIQSLSDNRFFLSATAIQPHTGGKSIILADYGDSIDNFKEKDLLNHFQDYEMSDWMGATLPPNVVHRDVWDWVGGYSVEYTPGMYSDPDFTAKLWFCGIRYMKGLSASRVYHFETKSTTRVKKNLGQIQFLMKWGITSSSFRKFVTWRDTPFDETKVGTINHRKIKFHVLRSRFKALIYLMSKDFGTVKKLWEV